MTSVDFQCTTVMLFSVMRNVMGRLVSGSSMEGWYLIGLSVFGGEAGPVHVSLAQAGGVREQPASTSSKLILVTCRLFLAGFASF